MCGIRFASFLTEVPVQNIKPNEILEHLASIGENKSSDANGLDLRLL